MTTIARERAVEAVRDGRARIIAALGEVSDDELERRGTIGGGDWSGKDLIGHLSCWEEPALEAVDARRAGRTPWVAATPKDADAINADAIAERADWPLERIRETAEDAHRRLCAAIEGMSDGEWTAEVNAGGGRSEPLSTFLGGVLGAPRRPFGHALAHLDDAEAFARRVGGTR